MNASTQGSSGAAGAGTWNTVEVGGHPCDIYQPPRANEFGYVLIYLHGVHQQTLHDKQPFLDFFDRHAVPVVCPRTQRSWWTDRICSEFDPDVTAEQYLLREVLPLVAARWGAEPPRIGLFGTSMGGQGALRFAYKHPNTFPVVAGIAPAIDYHLRIREGDPVLREMYRSEEQARQDTALLHIHPLNWPRHQFFCCDPVDHRWWEGVERLRMKLWSLGVPHEVDLESSHGGHGFDYYNAMAERALSFVIERLDAERKRLPTL